MHRRAITIALLASLVATAHVARAAGTRATSITDSDDVATALDVRLASVSATADDIAFSVSFHEGAGDPLVDVQWLVDDDGDDVADRVVLCGWDGTHLRAVVFDPRRRGEVAASVARPAPDTVVVRAPRAGIGIASTFAWAVSANSDANGNGRTEAGEVDVAPDGATFRIPALVERIAGADRVDTAVQASRDAFGDGAAASAVLARADAFADALAGVPLAVARRGPLLLTPSRALDARVEAELRRVLPRGAPVHVLGGTGALSTAVATRLQAAGFTVVRYPGTDRFDTSVRIARDGLGDPPRALLADGRTFADALAAGPAAAQAITPTATAGPRAVSPGSVLLTDGTRLPPVVRAYLDARSSIVPVAIGGPAAAAEPRARRVVGDDRFATAAAVAATFFPHPAVVGVASGGDFPDALVGGAHVAGLGGPLLLTARDELPRATHDALVAGRPDVGLALMYGGTRAVADGVEEAVRAALG